MILRNVCVASTLVYLEHSCRYLRMTNQQFWLKNFASTKVCDLYVEMVQGRHILMFYVHIAKNFSKVQNFVFLGQISTHKQ